MAKPIEIKVLMRWLGKLLLWLALAVLVLQMWYFAQIIAWTTINPSRTSFMDHALIELRQKQPNIRLKHEWVSFEAIDNDLKRAVIASEDAGFVEHSGVEWDAVEAALKKNLRRGRITHGGSTISQQLAKNLFLSGSRSFIRKAQELVITYMIEATWSKRRILEVYLNVVEWGNGVFGAQAASEHYFGTSAANLNQYQAARLAAMLPNPKYYDRNRQSGYLARHTGTVMVRMHQVAIPK